MKNELDKKMEVFAGIKTAIEICHGQAKQAGWWTDIETGKEITPNIGEKLMLIVSEIAEAMEGDRKNLRDSHLPHRLSIEVELADALIRIFDLAGALKLGLAGAMLEKLKYNSQRADHKIENRKLEDGKKY